MTEERHGADPFDSLLGGGTDHLTDQDRRLADLMDDVLVAYMPPDEPRRTLLLRRFTDFGTAVGETPSPRRRRVAAAVALAGTVTGKLMLGGAVAVAAVGGLHASGTVQVPLLPEIGTQAPVEEELDPADSPTRRVGREPDMDSPSSTPSPPTTARSPGNADDSDSVPTPPDGLVETTTPMVELPAPTITTPEPTVTLPDVTVPDLDVPPQP